MSEHTDDAGGCCGDDAGFFFDEQGDLIQDGHDVTMPTRVGRVVPAAATATTTPGILTGRPVIGRTAPCSFAVLNGSWLVEFSPIRVSPILLRQYIRGPMRIEVRGDSLRVSGDIYVRRTPLVFEQDEVFPVMGTPTQHTDADADTGGTAVGGLFPTIGVNGAPPFPSYPQLPKNQYSWYFRSTGVSYVQGVLTFSVVRHLWDRTSQEFVSTDTGTISLTCRRSILTAGPNPATMSGTAMIGGAKYSVMATKTANRYRGCAVEVDVMTGRTWPSSAVNGGIVRTFTNVYAGDGWDVPVQVDELNIANDASLTMAELQTLLTTHRAAAVNADQWRLWLLVGSRQGTLFGVMFDDDSVPREGAVGFADATLGSDSFIEASARNKPLNAVPAAFLRTLVHEAGHALNLFHPKHDVHNPPIGTEIMNQTGDVMGFASPAHPYPGNATFAFAGHDHDSLIHSPDPQVRPGWKNFGWGHGSLSAGLPTPLDAGGLTSGDDAQGLTLTLDLPAAVFIGEYVTADVTLTNTSDSPRRVAGRLNLAEGSLRFLHVLPDGTLDQVRDVVVACGPHPTTILAPGGSLTARMQVFFTSEGVTFDRSGTHVLRAEFDPDPFTTVRSARSTVRVRSAATETELDIATNTLDPPVGRAFALGDFGNNDTARGKLTAVAEAHHDADTGGAAALVLANSLARAHVDYRGGTRRDAAPDDAKHFLDLAVQGRSAQDVMRLAVTVASPVEADAPVVADSLARMKRARKGKEDLARSEAIAADFLAAAPT